MKYILIVTLILIATVCVDAQQPTPQLSLPCKVTEVYDGDTVTIELTLTTRVRLLDCWAPELRDAGGKESRDAIKQFEGKAGLIQIPLDKANRLDDVFTFGRILGYVWVDGKSVSEVQVTSGHATKVKQ